MDDVPVIRPARRPRFCGRIAILIASAKHQCSTYRFRQSTSMEFRNSAIHNLIHGAGKAEMMSSRAETSWSKSWGGLRRCGSAWLICGVVDVIALPRVLAFWSSGAEERAKSLDALRTLQRDARWCFARKMAAQWGTSCESARDAFAGLLLQYTVLWKIDGEKEWVFGRILLTQDSAVSPLDQYERNAVAVGPYTQNEK